MDYKTLLYELYKETKEQSDLFYQLDALGKEKNKDKFMLLLIKTYNCDYETAKIVTDHLLDNTPLPNKSFDLPPEQIAYNKEREMDYNQAYNYIYNDIGRDIEREEGYELLSFIAEDNMVDALKLIKTLTNCSFKTAELLWFDLKRDHGTPETNPYIYTEEEQALINAKARQLEQELQNKPKCPTCGSERIKKISTTAKVTGAAMFGLFSKTAKSQFKCENCGYKW